MEAGRALAAICHLSSQSWPVVVRAGVVGAVLAHTTTMLLLNTHMAVHVAVKKEGGTVAAGRNGTRRLSSLLLRKLLTPRPLSSFVLLAFALSSPAIHHHLPQQHSTSLSDAANKTKRAVIQLLLLLLFRRVCCCPVSIQRVSREAPTQQQTTREQLHSVQPWGLFSPITRKRLCSFAPA